MTISDLSVIFWVIFQFFFPAMAFVWAIKIVFGWLTQNL